MEFAGKEFIYLSKLKLDKVNNIIKTEEENKEEAPGIKEVKEEKEEDEKEEPKKEEKKKEEEPKEESENDDMKEVEDMIEKNMKKGKRKLSSGLDRSCEALSVCSCSFDKDLENSDDEEMENEEPAPMDKKGQVFKKEIDTNICVVRFTELEKKAESILLNTVQCKTCKSYFNKYSNFVKSENGKIEWKCEFCHEINKDLEINDKDIPDKEIVEKCIEPPIELDKKEKDKQNENDSSLIFCFDISGSMSQSYNVGEELKEKFNKIVGKNKKNNETKGMYNSDSEGEFDYGAQNTSYLSRLDLVKFSIENNIKSLLKNSPNVKVGLVSFGSEIDVKGDCLSNVMKIKEKDMDNEAKIISLGEENTNLIKNPLKVSSKKILQTLEATEEMGSTALGPAVLLSLSLLKNAKIGSRIFLCTDGMSNLGVGDISANKEEAKKFYEKIGETAKSRGIIINLITFDDSESEIEVLMKMVQNSGGEIVRVNANAILDGFNDLLENEAIASEVSIKMNLNKCMTFRDEEEKYLINNNSSISKNLGNVTKESESYFELKFKKAIELVAMKDIKLEDIKTLTFQCEILYKTKNGGKYIRVISKNLKVSTNKEDIEKQADFEIISTMEMHKTARLAKEGKFREAQAQAHVARKYFNLNRAKNKSVEETYNMFNNNMNDFNYNLGKMHFNLNKKYKGSEKYKYKKKKKLEEKSEDDDKEVDNNNDDDDEEKSDEEVNHDHFSQQVYSISHVSRTQNQRNFFRKKK